jgi:hypothetical protein
VAITTTDVVTNAVSGNEVIKNASCVVYCYRTGEYESLQSDFQGSATYNQLETKYTDRFDNINYYNGIDGGSP